MFTRMMITTPNRVITMMVTKTVIMVTVPNMELEPVDVSINRFNRENFKSHKN